MYRYSVMVALIAAPLFGVALPASAKVGSIAPSEATIHANKGLIEPVACGSRGGPGGREANGKCASWGKSKRRK